MRGATYTPPEKVEAPAPKQAEPRRTRKAPTPAKPKE